MKWAEEHPDEKVCSSEKICESSSNLFPIDSHYLTVDALPATRFRLPHREWFSSREVSTFFYPC